MIELSGPSLLTVATGLLGSAWASGKFHPVRKKKKKKKLRRGRELNISNLGAMASLTITGIPAAKAFPKTAAQTWAIIFDKGLATIPPTAVVAGLLYGYAAWDASSRPKGQTSYLATAAVLSAGIVPFTFFFMADTNSKLHAVAKGVSTLSEVSVLALADKWGSLNLARSLLPFTATLLAGFALFKELSL